MAEGVDALAVDVRDGAGGAHGKIAAEQRHAHRVARGQRSRRRRRRGLPRPCRRRDRHTGKPRQQLFHGAVGEPAHGERHRDGPQVGHRRAGQAGASEHLQEVGVRGAEGGGRRQRLAPQRQEFGRRHGPIEGDGDRPGRPRDGEARGVGHLGDGRDTGDRLLRELAELIRHRSDQLAVDVDGAPAHAGDDTRLRQRAALETRQDQVALGRDDALQRADDVDPELFDAVALEDRAPDADHAGLHVRDGHQRVAGGDAGPGERQGADDGGQQEERGRTGRHGDSLSFIRGSPGRRKPAGGAFDRPGSVCYRLSHTSAMSFAPVPHTRQALSAGVVSAASRWYWYWRFTEGAPGLA